MLNYKKLYFELLGSVSDAIDELIKVINKAEDALDKEEACESGADDEKC